MPRWERLPIPARTPDQQTRWASEASAERKRMKHKLVRALAVAAIAVAGSAVAAAPAHASELGGARPHVFAYWTNRS